MDLRFLQPSPYEADDGNHIGADPRTIPQADLLELGGPTSPGKAIRAKCLDCCCGNAAEVRRCVSIRCALWPYRMGKNPFHAQSGKTKPFPRKQDEEEEVS